MNRQNNDPELASFIIVRTPNFSGLPEPAKLEKKPDP